MALTIVSADDTNGITFAQGTDITVLSGVTVSNAAPSGDALRVTSTTYNDGQVTILGTLVADRFGIDAILSLNGSNSVSGSTFYIGSTGQIFAGSYGIVLQDGANASPVINYGEIYGSTSAINISSASGGGGAFNIVNYGAISSSDSSTIDIGLGNTGSILNTGTMTNLGSQTVVLALSGGALDLRNSGTMSTGGEIAIFSSAAADIYNSGDIFGGVFLSVQADIIRNTGLIDGDIYFASSNDVYRGFGGTVTGIIRGESGDDTFFVDQVDVVIDGGLGYDTVYARADFTSGGGIEKIVLQGSDNLDATGDYGANVIRGNKGDNDLNGGSGIDTLFGGVGNDVLNGGADDDILRGGAGNDILVGGTGLDVMFGGTGPDVFVFETVADSGTGALRDRIRDFEIGIDLIDLSGLSDEEFSFEGTTGFSATGPSLYYSVNAAGRAIVRLDVDGDGAQDMQILLNDVTLLTADDFIL